MDKLGLEKYGTAGEPFDPTVHEALTHSEDDSVTETTCVAVLPAGLPVRRPGAASGPGRRRRPPRLTTTRDAPKEVTDERS